VVFSRRQKHAILSRPSNTKILLLLLLLQLLLLSLNRHCLPLQSECVFLHVLLFRFHTDQSLRLPPASAQHPY
jgi:hypothetical protein